MKSAHRHDLQTNELGKLAQKATPFLEKYGTKILIAFCAVLIVAAGVIWWIRRSRAETAIAWTQLADAQSTEDFGNVADAYGDSAAGRWARLREGELHLESGVRYTFEDREAAEADLKRARDSFQKLLDTDVTGVIKERALLGMARYLETTSDGDTGLAIEAYRKLLNEFPDSVYRTFAERRISELESGGARQFYAWFSKQSPKPPDLARPRDGAAGGPSLPSVGGSLGRELDGLATEAENGGSIALPPPAADSPIEVEDQPSPPEPTNGQPDAAAPGK